MTSNWTQATCTALAVQHCDRDRQALYAHARARTAGRSLRFLYCYCVSLLLCVPLFGIDRDRRIDQLQHTSWTAKDGAAGSVTSVAQTTYGYLWIGTASGLVRFDGIRFEPFKPLTGQILPATYILSLLAVPDCGLWIEFSSGNASFLKNGSLTNYGEREGLPRGSLMAFARSASGTIWAAEDSGGFFLLEGSRQRKIGMERNFSGDASTVFEDRKGTIWVGSMEKIQFLVRGEDRFHVAVENLRHPLGLAESPGGTLWMAEVAHAVRPVPLPSRGQTVPQPEIQVVSRAILFDRAGSLWITQLGDGLRRVPCPERLNGLKLGEFSDAAEMFTQMHGLSVDHVRCILEDREGNIWTGTNMGIDRFRQTALVPISFSAGTAGFELTAGDCGMQRFQVQA